MSVQVLHPVFSRHSVRLFLALASVYLIWGSTFLAVRSALQSFPPLALSSARFGVAGSLVLLFTFRKENRLPSRAHWISAAIIGSLLITVGVGLVAWAQKSTSSGQAALLSATPPIWIAVWTILRRKYPGHCSLAGVTLASLGLLLLVGDLGRPDPQTLALLTASLGWTAATLISPNLPKPDNSLQFSGMTMLVAGAELSVASLLAGEELSGPITAASLIAWLYLVLAGSLIGMTAYTWLLRHTSAALASTHTYVNPVVAVALSSLIGEKMPAETPLSLLLIVAGVALLTLKEVTLSPRVFRTWIPMVGNPGPLNQSEAAPRK